jgi:molybdopterin molybdotransferase
MAWSGFEAGGAPLKEGKVEENVAEIDEGVGYVGYQEAFRLVVSHVKTVGIEKLPLDACACRTLSENLVARLSYPSSDVSLKDGYAVRSESVAAASHRRPIFLPVKGSAFAGSSFGRRVKPGSAVRICSGAPIPRGLDAVVSGEFCEEVSPGEVRIRADAERGRNVLRKGGEIKAGAVIARKGEHLLPGCLGLATAAGISHARVYRRPRVALVGVGDEVVIPGQPLRPGQLYSSNLVTMGAWLGSFNLPQKLAVVKDDKKSIKRKLITSLPAADVILTSGGAWGSERDLVVGVLDGLGWQKIFHHVRMGPGKGVAFGIWEGKPVFCLPGGPASNEMAFLQFALPGIIRMAGERRHPLRSVPARLTETLTARHPAWTEFKDAILSCDSDGNYTVAPYNNRSRLQSIARANSLICIPEGRESLKAGQVIPIQVLTPSPGVVFF